MKASHGLQGVVSFFSPWSSSLVVSENSRHLITVCGVLSTTTDGDEMGIDVQRELVLFVNEGVFARQLHCGALRRSRS